MFNANLSNAKNTFIKHDQKMLRNVFGSSDTTPYWIADMDFKVAEPITEELLRLVKRGVYGYEFDKKSMATAISSWYKKRHQFNLPADNFLQVSGVLSGLALLVREFSNKDDSVLIHNPAYHQFENLIHRAGRNVVKSPLVPKGGEYRIDYEDYERKIQSEKVKIVIFCNPHNPTGRVWSKQELKQLVNISRRNNVLLISDEIHSDIVYKGNKFTSLATLEYDKLITLIGSPAKTFGMQSISTAFVYVANPGLLKQCSDLFAATYLDHGNAFSTFATITAYSKGEAWLDGLLKYLEETVNWIESFISQNIPSLRMYRPQGTYQIWFDFSDMNLERSELEHLIYGDAKMGLTPGSWFGAESHNFMRMNIATSRETIIDSFVLLKQAIKDNNQPT